MICVSIGHSKFEDALNLAPKVQMMEFRADLLDWSHIQYQKIMGIVPVSLFTFRHGTATATERLECYRLYIENGVDYIDVDIEEDESFIARIREFIKHAETKLVLSYHNFDKTPDLKSLTGIIKRCYDEGAEVAKIACQVNEEREAASLLSLYGLEGRKVVAGMGSKGKIVRLASLFLGAEFSFAAPDEEHATAPGQMTWYEMEAIVKTLHKGL